MDPWCEVDDSMLYLKDFREVWDKASNKTAASKKQAIPKEN